MPHRGLLLSLFPGLDALGMGFEAEGWCVVKGPDVIAAGDIRSFHPPPGHFDGVIGGPPCQAFSSLANLVRAKGLEPKFGNLIPEFSRCVEESSPTWFLMENVPKAPDPEPRGYDFRSFPLDHSTLDSGDGTGHEQMRRRRFWFGVRDGDCPELRQWVDFALFLPEEVAPVTGRNEGRVGSPTKDYSPPRRTLAEMLELQGLPPDLLDHCPWTMQGKRKAVGNCVPLPMARQLARAIRMAMNESRASEPSSSPSRVASDSESRSQDATS